MQKYKLGTSLGDGSFGTVTKAINQKTGKVVAIKKIKQKFSTWEECMALNQIKVLSKLHHPNIINMYQLIKFKSELYFVFEYMSRNVYQMIREHEQRGQPIQEIQIRNIVYQTIQALAYMHRHGYFHRDLKPQNLLEMNGTVKVADFGLVRQIRAKPPFTQYVSTRWYRAPQVILRSRNYSSPMDMFAMGTIMAQLYKGIPLFPGSNQREQLIKILQVMGTPKKDEWPDGYALASKLGMEMPQFNGVKSLADLIPRANAQAISLISAMIQVNPHKRITAHQALQHQYFMIRAPLDRPIFHHKMHEIEEQQDWVKQVKYKPGYVCK